jgi:hypothetical protein
MPATKTRQTAADLYPLGKGRPTKLQQALRQVAQAIVESDDPGSLWEAASEQVNEMARRIRD